MREIKFRAWINNSKKFEAIEFIGAGQKTFPIYTKDNKYWFPMQGVLEQYTGLKDFNGAEIYEGDILQDVDDSTIVGIVEYDEAFGEYDCGDNNLYECTRDCIVIGNIHENPELLEEQ